MLLTTAQRMVTEVTTSPLLSEEVKLRQSEEDSPLR